MSEPTVGDRVRIERDEMRYPSKGTWPQFRGRTGTIVEINLGEYGVVFGGVRPRTDGRGRSRWSGPVTWFRDYELRTTGKASGSDSDGIKVTPEELCGRGLLMSPSTIAACVREILDTNLALNEEMRIRLAELLSSGNSEVSAQ
jgi:hypothetical protein